MIYIIFSFLMFCFSVFAHVLYCRVHSKQQLHTKVYCLIAMALMAMYVGLVLLVKHLNLFPADSLMGVPLLWTGLLIFFLLVPIYLRIYVLTQLTSPSKKILETIVAGKQVTYDDIYKAIAAEDFIGTRLRDLGASGCITDQGGVYTITTSGKAIVRILEFMQKSLGRGVGG